MIVTLSNMRRGDTCELLRVGPRRLMSKVVRAASKSYRATAATCVGSRVEFLQHPAPMCAVAASRSRRFLSNPARKTGNRATAARRGACSYFCAEKLVRRFINNNNKIAGNGACLLCVALSLLCFCVFALPVAGASNNLRAAGPTALAPPSSSPPVENINSRLPNVRPPRPPAPYPQAAAPSTRSL
jgi:hypothetical protein